MAHDSFVQFLRREASYYAQEIAEDAIIAAKRAFEHFETMCSDPRADLQAPVEDGSRTISLGDLRQNARSLSESLDLLLGHRPLTDNQATCIITSLTHTCHDLRDAAQQYSHLAGAKDLDKACEGLAPLATGLRDLFDSHAAGIEEGLKRRRATQTESRSSGPRPTRSHSGRNCER